MSERAIHPVYVDGPLTGQDFPVSAGTWHVNAYEPPLADPHRAMQGGSLFGDMRLVTYRIARFGFHSGGEVAMFLVASCEGEPSASVLAEFMFSEAARAAMTIEPVVGRDDPAATQPSKEKR